MKTTRPRGFIQWKPRQAVLARLDMINEVLEQYIEHLPLTIRQIFYRLVGAYDYPKTEKDYGNLCETLNRARRAGFVDMNAIRDDGFNIDRFQGYDNGRHWLENIKQHLDDFRLDRQQGQHRRLIVWAEAAGMVPQLRKVASQYSVPVASSGGFDSTTAKHDAAKWLAGIGSATVLHIGDHDPSGVHLFGSLDEDVSAFVQHYGGEVDFIRLAVTQDQILTYDLPTAPAKVTDRRKFEGLTTQVESLDPRTLSSIVRRAIESRICWDTYQAALECEQRTQAELRLVMESALANTDF